MRTDGLREHSLSHSDKVNAVHPTLPCWVTDPDVSGGVPTAGSISIMYFLSFFVVLREAFFFIFQFCLIPNSLSFSSVFSSLVEQTYSNYCSSFCVSICKLYTILIQLKKPLKIVPTTIFAVTKKDK